jgi:hypothetical protein
MNKETILVVIEGSWFLVCALRQENDDLSLLFLFKLSSVVRCNQSILYVFECTLLNYSIAVVI